MGWGVVVCKVGVLRAAIVSLVALIVASCALVDSVDPRYDTINRSTTKARNESILLNIVRASQNVPLNFITFSRVSGSTTANVAAGAPTFLIGGNPVPTTIQRDVTFNNSTFNTSLNAAGSFDITVLESKDFYTALLSPVDLVTLNYFLHQGYPRSLLFWLFTDSVRVTINGVKHEIRNLPDRDCEPDPKSHRESCFSDMVKSALATGLTVETVVDQHLPAASAGGGQQKESKPVTIVYARLCYDQVLADRAPQDFGSEVNSAVMFSGAQHRPTCGGWKPDTKKLGGDTLTFEWVGTPRGTIRYEIITRSTFGIYQFLGRILSQHTNDLIRIPIAPDSEEDNRILAVTTESSGGCFVDINFDGNFYCVPQKGAENTKRIFSLLAQLLALKTQTQDLAITPTVRVAP